MPDPETYNTNVAPPPQAPPSPHPKQEGAGGEGEGEGEDPALKKKQEEAAKKKADDAAEAGAKAYAATQNPGPPGSPGGRQRYNVGVPYSQSGLTLGASA